MESVKDKAKLSKRKYMRDHEKDSDTLNNSLPSHMFSTFDPTHRNSKSYAEKVGKGFNREEM